MLLIQTNCYGNIYSEHVFSQVGKMDSVQCEASLGCPAVRLIGTTERGCQSNGASGLCVAECALGDDWPIQPILVKFECTWTVP